jgi:DNA-directed RNA polymerase subunit RPC12/RpoP
MARRAPSRTSLVWLVVFIVVASLLTDASVVALLVAALVVWVLFKIGFAMLGGLARPIPEPPPPGELRKVKITYRCSICGTEVRMTVANDQMPDPPRHCQEDMELVTPVDDL